MPTAIVDLVGTFFSLEPLRQRLTALGAPEHALELWFSQAREDALAVSQAGDYLPFDELLAAALPRTLAQLGKANPEPARVELVLKGLRVLNPGEGAIESATRFTRAGWRLVALTHFSEDHARGLLERAGLLGSFAAVLSSDRVQRARPHPEVYGLVQPHLDGEGWMLSVHPWDLYGARRAGLHSAWISRRERRWLSAFAPPDLEAPDLATCAKLLDEQQAAAQSVSVAAAASP